MNTKKLEYPENLYCNIFGCDKCVDTIIEHSILLKNMNMALDIFKNRNQYPTSQIMVEVAFMYYKDRISIHKIAVSIDKSTARVRDYINNLTRYLRHPYYAYIIKNGKIKPEDNKNNIDEDSIDVLNLSARARNCLRYGRIKTITELTGVSEEYILSMDGTGEKTLNEIKEKLENIGLSLTSFDPEVLSTNICELNLNKRLYQYLRDNNFNTIMDLIKNKDNIYYDDRCDIEARLKPMGLSLNIKVSARNINKRMYNNKDLLNKLIYELSYEDACKLLLQIRTDMID